MNLAPKFSSCGAKVQVGMPFAAVGEMLRGGERAVAHLATEY